jgi:hypothetical protein
LTNKFIRLVLSLGALFIFNCSSDNARNADNKRAEEEELKSVSSEKLEPFVAPLENGTKFYTYLPENDFTVSGGGSGDGHINIFYSKKDPSNKTYVWFFFPNTIKTTTVFGLEQLLNARGGLIDTNKWAITAKTEKTPYNWIRKAMDFTGKEKGNPIKGTIFICKASQMRNAFYIIIQYPEKNGDWFHNEARTILGNVKFSEPAQG